MPRTLEHEIYKSKVINCRRCLRRIGETAFDSQVLILESGLVAYNYFCFRCPCGKNASWLAPILPNETAEAVPDVGEIQHRALSLKDKIQKSGGGSKEIALSDVRKG